MLNRIVKQNQVFIIAEIGKNFIQTKEDKSVEEYLDNAKQLIKAAKETGADAVKFQTHNLEDEFLNVNVVSPHFVDADRYNWIKRNQTATPLEFWQELKKYCNELDIIFFSTPMSRGAAVKLNEIGVDLWKVGSGDILDFVMLDYLTEADKPIIISSGMSTLAEIDLTLRYLQKKIKNVILMHCVSMYPCPPDKLNLKTIEFFQKRYNVPIGFSDHSLGIESAIAAVNMGAIVIEKHFSFSRDLWGADHKASLTPKEFKEMVSAIKRKEITKLDVHGNENKVLQDEESVFRSLFRKSLVASQDISAGAVITKEMIYAMRPQQFIGGLPSEEYESVLGKKIKKSLKKYEPVNWAMLE